MLGVADGGASLSFPCVISIYNSKIDCPELLILGLTAGLEHPIAKNYKDGLFGVRPVSSSLDILGGLDEFFKRIKNWYKCFGWPHWLLKI